MNGSHATAPVQAIAAHTGRNPALRYMGAFIVLGFSASILGPSADALAVQLAVKRGSIGVLFAASAIGYFFGSLVGGRVYDKGLGHKAMATAFGVLGVFALLIPRFHSLAALAMVFFFVGAAGAAMDVGANTLLVWNHSQRHAIDEKPVGPWLNALHMFFGIGALLAPPAVYISLRHDNTLGLVSIVLAVAAVGAAVMLWRAETPNPEHHAEESTAPQSTFRLAIIAGFFVLYVGSEVGFAGWISSYARDIHLGGSSKRSNDAAASGVTTAFWAAFTVGRLLSIGIARRVSAAHMVVGSCTMAATVAGAMIVANGNHPAVWILTVLFGLAVAPQFASMVNFASTRLTLTSNATSWFLGASSIGGLTVPWLIGRLLDSSGAKAMPIVVTVVASMTVVWLGVIARVHPRSA